MKKIFLLLATGVGVFGAKAQYMNHKSVVANDATQFQFNIANSPVLPAADMGQKGPAPVAAAATGHHSTARTTAVPFTTTETFGSTTSYTVMPTGWTAGVLPQNTGVIGTWHWANHSSGAPFGLVALKSSTASNGWMIFDSDSLGYNGTTYGTGTALPAGWLQSPTYSCTGHTTVRLNFQEYFRRFYDTCWVYVSNQASPTFAAGTYTVFPVATNNKLGNSAGTTNVDTQRINISSAAANQATVTIRFATAGGHGGGGYGWSIDDVNLSEMDPHDVSVAGGWIYMPDSPAYQSTIMNTPLNMVDTVFPVGVVSNYGANAEANVAVNAHIFNGTTSVYNNNKTVASLPAGFMDSVVDGYPGYRPTSIGNYICAFSTTVPNDAIGANNYDTTLFNVTDTLWQPAFGKLGSSYYCYNSATSSAYFTGTRFDIPLIAQPDTVTGFGVSFNSTTVPTTAGASVSVQLYSIVAGGTMWTYIGSSLSKPIVAADISTATTTVWSEFRMDKSAGPSSYILQPGYSYAAVVQVNGVTTTVLINSVPTPHGSPNSFLYLGQSFASSNDGGQTFGTTQQTGISDVPLVRMYLGHLPVGIESVNGNINTINAYPNPSSDILNVTFGLSYSTNVSVSLTNMIGQTVATQNMNNVSAGKAVFNTSSLAPGMYIYTVEANGQRATGHVVIAH